jgi:hypothetical protein
MAEDKAELLEHYRRMRAEFRSAIAGLDDTKMVEPSIDGWSVKDHMAHIALWDDMRATEVVRITAGFESALRMSGTQDEEYNALQYLLRRDLSLAQVRWELELAWERLDAALAGIQGPGLEPESYGEAGLRSTHQAEHAGWIRRWRGEQGL